MPRTRTLDALFRPRSVAVVGASRREGAIGRQVVANIVASGFTGPVWPVNRKADVVLSMPTHQNVLAIPGPVDLAVLVVPPDEVLRTAEECGKKGVQALVVVTAGFREIGGKGIAREEKLKDIAARHGMRVIGPNCMGVINTAPDVRLNASFAATLPSAATAGGGVAMVTQSGALGEAILADAASARLGVAMFASVGNLVDVSVPELIEYWEDDPAVRVILLYLESFGDATRFVEVARRTSRKKPLVAVKSGSSAAGAAAAGSHTGAVAGPDVAADTLLAQAGVLRVTSFRQMFALAAALMHQPLPQGRRIAIVTNAGGPGILATDAVSGGGLEMAPLAARTTTSLRAALPVEASVQNPVDLIASADAARYRAALKPVVRDPNVDALLVMFVSPIMIDAVAVAEAIVAGTRGSDKTTLACVMGRQRGREALDLLTENGIPVFRYPEDAAATLGFLCRRAEWLRRRPGRVPEYAVDHAAAAAVLKRAKPAAGGWLAAVEVEQVLAAYGIPLARSHRVEEPEPAAAAAARLGFPVVLKAEAPDLLHKSEERAVVPGLQTEDEVRAAATDLLRRLRKRHRRLVLQVQEQARGHRELLLGMVRDPRYGPLFTAGIGGTEVEVWRDVAMRLAPMDHLDPPEMFASLKGAALLGAFRGQPAVDLVPAQESLLRLQQLVLAFPRIAEVEINPFIAAPRGTRSVGVDARLRLA